VDGWEGSACTGQHWQHPGQKAAGCSGFSGVRGYEQAKTEQ